MDIVRIEPTMLCGHVQVPPSKSLAHRALIAAALSGKCCTINNIVLSKDIRATLSCLKALGYDGKFQSESKQVFFSGTRKKIKKELHLCCEESGSTLRFFIPLSLVFSEKVVFSGKGRLMERPQKPYLDIFEEKGIKCYREKDAMTIEGRLMSGRFSLPGDVSSQFVTGLLLALPLLEGDSEIIITSPMESKGYLDLTLSVLQEFGIRVDHDNYRHFFVSGGQTYQSKEYVVEGDYSQAAFFLVAGALGCDLQCHGLNAKSLQGDREIIEVLKRAGAKMKSYPDGAVQALATNAMRGLVIDAREIPDLVPILAVLCCFLEGESRIINAGRLRIKESDRLAAMTKELRRLGAEVEEGDDFLKIHGKQTLCGATVSSWNDHRIAMALSVAACRCEGAVTITGGKTAVKKSYPDFYDVYRGLCQGPKTLLQFGEEIKEKG